MESLIGLTNYLPNSTFLLGLILWEIIWKGFALWRAGRRNQPAWFFLLFVLNTAGILPIVYLFMTRDKKQNVQKTVSTQRVSASQKKKK